jgi:hypothetical protein
MKLKFIILSLLPFFISYSLCCIIIFNPPHSQLIQNKNISNNKKAIIFYCNGEMEKYSPKYAGYLMKDVNILLKPFYSKRIKKLYKAIDIKSKNSDILLTAKAIKNSILNYKPYYFYIAFSSYFPNLNSSIQSAMKDGCKELTIINYSTLPVDEANIDIKTLKSYGISVNITKPIYCTQGFVNAMIAKISNMVKPDNGSGILLLDNQSDTSNKIKTGLIEMGYNDKNIIISTNIDKSINDFKTSNVKNILYLNLMDSSGSYQSELILPHKFERYALDMKITGLNSWGYDTFLVKAAIDSIK